jgi:hypothetical protein
MPESKGFKLHNLEMDENHCRVLGACSRPGLEIVLVRCKITSAGAGALAEVLGRNQGPPKLNNCDVDNLILADGLRGNSCLKSWILRIPSDLEVSNRQVLAIADTVRENEGLFELEILFDGYRVSNEMWGAICDSLKTHPTLEVLNLRWTFTNAAPAPAVLTSRIQALVDLLKVNMSIHTIGLDPCYSQHELLRESVIPYLDTNRFRPRVRAIQKTRPIPYRAKVLGRALLSARTDANSFWMLLSGNAEVAFPSRNTTIAPAANLPTPATAAAAATSTASVATVTVSAMPALTNAATGSLPTVTATATATAATSAATPSTASVLDAFAPTIADASAANAATPSACQKRKARP